MTREDGDHRLVVLEAGWSVNSLFLSSLVQVGFATKRVLTQALASCPDRSPSIEVDAHS